MCGLEVSAQILGGFADDLDVPYDRVLGLGVGHEGILTLPGVVQNSPDRILNMQQIGPIVHKGTASRRMLASI